MATEPGIRIHRHPYRRRPWLGVLAGLAGLGLSGWLCWPARAPAEAEFTAPAATVQAAAASGASIRPFWSLAREAEGQVLAEHYRRAGVLSLSPPPGSRISAEEWEARRVDARWCAEGGVRWEGSGEPPPALAVWQTAQQQLAQAWARQLRQRGEIQASLAAEWLELSFPTEPAMAARARARLQDLARSSRQPVAVSIALQMGCADAASCTPVPASLWTELEPDNRLAWLAQLSKAKSPAEQLELLNRVVQATQHIDYGRELLRTVLSLPQEPQLGLRRGAQYGLWMAALVAKSRTSVAAALRLCKGAETLAKPGLQAQCRILAEQLWRDGEDLLSHALALKLGQAVDAANPQWAERSAELLRVQSASPFDLEAFVREHGDQAVECVNSPLMNQMFMDLAAKGEWALMQSHAVASGGVVAVPDKQAR